MKHLLSTLLLSCTFISVTAMDKTNGNPSSMNVSEADSLRTELPSVDEDDFKDYKATFIKKNPQKRHLPGFDIYKQYLQEVYHLRTDEISNQGFKFFKDYWSCEHKEDQYKLEELQTLNQQAPNELSNFEFELYCEWLGTTPKTSWEFYTYYWMYKNNNKKKDYNDLPPKEKMGLLHKYAEYVTGKTGKTFLEAFKEYKEKNNPNTRFLANYFTYEKFFIETCSLNERERNSLGAEILNDYTSALDQLLPNELSFQDYCKWRKTETDNWDVYIQYWMYKTGKKDLTPEDRMSFLNEHMKYALDQKAIATGANEKIVPETFEEYRKQNRSNIETDDLSLYKEFIKKKYSLSENDIRVWDTALCQNYQRYYKNTVPTAVVDSTKQHKGTPAQTPLVNDLNNGNTATKRNASTRKLRIKKQSILKSSNGN